MLIKTTKPNTIRVMFDNEEHNEKPKNIGVIKNRIKDNVIKEYKTMKEVEEEILKGKTMIPGGIKGNVEKNWKEQSIFLLDFDNSIDNEDIKSDDIRHSTPQNVLEFAQKEGIEPTIIYNTFSNSEEQRKFRFVYIFNKPIKNLKIAKKILLYLIEKFKQFHPDESKKNLADIFFGGKSIFFSKENFYTVEENEETEKENPNQKEGSSQEQKNVVEEETINQVNKEELKKHLDKNSGITYKVPDGFLVDKNSGEIYRKGKNGFERLSPNLVLITGIIINVDNNTEKVKLQVEKRGQVKDGIFLKSQVYNSPSELADFGISINSINSRDFIKYLSELENENQEVIPLIRAVSKLGWRENVFIPFTKETDILVDADYKLQKWVNAYSSQGTSEEWIEKIRPFRTNVIFRFILASSFAAPLLKPLEHRIFIVYNWGNSRAR